MHMETGVCFRREEGYGPVLGSWIYVGGWIYADEGQAQETEEWPEVEEGLLGSRSHQKDRGSGVQSDQ